MHANKKHIRVAVKCPKCNESLDMRLRRNAVLKTIFFWLPVRVYFCAKCRKRRYVLRPKTNRQSLVSA